MQFKNRIQALNIFRHIAFAILVAIWLMIYVIIFSLIAGGGAIEKNSTLVFSIALIPPILLTMIGNFASDISISRLDFFRIRSDSTYELESKKDILDILLMAWKLNKLGLIYVLFAGLFVRMFSGVYDSFAITSAVIGITVIAKTLDFKNLVPRNRQW